MQIKIILNKVMQNTHNLIHNSKNSKKYNANGEFSEILQIINFFKKVLTNVALGDIIIIVELRNSLQNDLLFTNFKK